MSRVTCARAQPRWVWARSSALPAIALLATGCAGPGSPRGVALEARCEADAPARDLRLVDAARRSATAEVARLLSAKVDVDAARSDGVTALHWAARLDSLEVVKLLLAAGAQQRPDLRGVTPLHLACARADVAMIEQLLDHGASANAGNPGGETALMTAARTGSVDAVRLLLDRGAAIDWQDAVRGHTALMYAVEENQIDVVKLLLERKAKLDIQSDMTAPQNVSCSPRGDSIDIGAHGDGFYRTMAVATPTGALTALHIAARDGRTELVQLLVAAGADVNLVAANGTPPLTTAISNNHMALALHLLAHGANPHVADNFYHRTPLFAAVEARNPDHWGGLPNLPSDGGDALALIRALLAAHVDVDPRTNTTPIRGFAQASGQWLSFDGQTPFILAALSGDVTVMKLLLAHGADPNLKTKHGSSALMAAAGMNWVVGQTHTRSKEEYLEAARLCIAKGNQVNDRNSAGLTALHAAANRGFDEMIELLAAHGAQLEAQDRVGRTPMKFAEGVFLAAYPATRKPSTIALLQRLIEHPPSAPAAPSRRGR